MGRVPESGQREAVPKDSSLEGVDHPLTRMGSNPIPTHIFRQRKPHKT